MLNLAVVHNASILEQMAEEVQSLSQQQRQQRRMHDESARGVRRRRRERRNDFDHCASAAAAAADLLVRRNSFLHLNPLFHLFDRVRWHDVECDDLTRQRLHMDRHRHDVTADRSACVAEDDADED
jgi:hypothetical protein